MRMWVDADHCPSEIREMVSRAARKNAVEAVFVANHPPPLDSSPFLKAMKADGVELQACVVCADSYGVSDALRGMGIEVKPMGKPLTDMLQTDWKVVTF